MAWATATPGDGVLRVEVRLRRTAGGLLVRLEDPRGVYPEGEDTVCWAEWARPVTAGQWKAVRAAARHRPESARDALEVQAWRLLLVRSGLVPGWEGPGPLPEARLAEVLAFSPGFVPSALVAPVFPAVRVTAKEEREMEIACMRAFGGVGGRLVNPPPLVAEALAAMSLAEKYGIPAYADADAMPAKTQEAFRLVAGFQAKALDAQQQAAAIRAQTKQAAGIR